VLSRLAGRGWVEHIPSAVGSSRRVWKLTRSGAALVARLQPVWQERESRLQADLTGQERKLLLQLLERLFRASERLRAEEARMLPRPSRRPAPRRALSGT
jgi:DNA-binding MarR family transcriptional regulator